MQDDEQKTLAEIWHQRIQLWQLSEQVAGSVRCKERNLIYHQFVYWKECLKQKNKRDKTLSSVKFVEIVDTPEFSAPGVLIEYRGAGTHLARNFDDTAFLQCLHMIGDL